jgi:hypothetical protein
MDGQWDNLQTAEDIKIRMDKVVCDGFTPLGTILSKKVLNPMVLDKARHGLLKKACYSGYYNRWRGKLRLGFG